ncbi:hypothetical protein [Streptomyces griseus]|uniref:hypothetical protein n=1 Tax=Streptomyces griseus TaxID=1911 RepID=UPI0036602953
MTRARPTVVNYFDTRCPSGVHFSHPNLTCEEIGDRAWDPITGYRTWDQFVAEPPEFTGLAHLITKEA